MKHYPAQPHGDLEEVFEGIWFIKGAVKMPMVMPMRISRSMTIVRTRPDELAVVNSMRLSEGGFAKLDRLGAVKHVLRVGGFHGRDDGYYRERYGAKIYAIEGQSYSRKLDAKRPPQSYLEPDEWLTETSALPIEGARLKIIQSSNPPEAVLLLEREGGILVTGDSLQNTPGPDEFTNFPAKIMMKKFGFWGPHQVGPGWLQFARPSAAEVRSLLDLEFEHVLPGHGEVVRGQAREKYMPQVMGELKGCHA